MHLCSQCTYALIILCNLKSLVPYRRTIIETSTMPQLQHPPNVWIVEASTAVPPHVHAARSTPTSPVGIYAGSDTSLACPTTDCLDASLLAGSDTSDCPAARTSPTLAVSSNHSSTPVFHVERGQSGQEEDERFKIGVHERGPTILLPAPKLLQNGISASSLHCFCITTTGNPHIPP